VWELKEKTDVMRRIPTSLHEFMYQHLRKVNNGSQEMIAEFGYNLQAALQRYAYDADVELFLKVLNGDISEEVKGDRERLINGLMLMFKSADASGSPDVGGLADDSVGSTKPGFVKREHIHQALEDFFPAKSTAAMAAIIRALQDDQPGEPVNYLELFEEDEDMNQGQFVETILDQHLAEIQEYVQGLTDAINRVGDKVAKASGLNKGDPVKIPILAAKEAILSYEPGKPEEEVDAYIARGARLGTLSDVHIQCDLGMEVVVNEFISRMKTGLVKRSDNFNLAAVLQWQKKGQSKPKGAVSQPGMPSIA